MSEHDPISEAFVMGDAMTDHNGVVCYPAMLQNSEEKYIVKKISVPATDVSLEALLMSGACASREDALAYYRSLAEEILQEAKVLTELSAMEGFLPFHSACTNLREDGNGYTVSLVAPYRDSLEQVFSEQIMTHQGIMDLAMDLCTALAACRRAGYLYIDLKPGNIFSQEDKQFRIGDLGFVALDSLRFASLPEKYHSLYTAPEIEDALSQLNTTLDVYALGLILYQAYNGGHLPLEDGKLANPLLPPVYADYEMAEIILTACHPDPQRRWEDPTQLGQALVQYMQRNGVSDDPIIPPPVTTPELDAGEDFLPEDLSLDAELADQIPDLDIFQEIPTPDDADVDDFDAAMLEMMAQVDDLIAHELPAPAVAPEPVEIPMPDPIPTEPEEIPEQTAASEEVTEEIVPAEIAVEEPAVEETPDIAPEPAVQPEEAPADAVDLTVTATPVKEKIHHPRRKAALRILLPVLILCLLAAAAVIGIRHYRSNTIMQIHSLQISGTADSISVTIDSDLEESLLIITCTDAYGNSQSSIVVDGQAAFIGLSPQTRYTIRVTTTGKYKLTGQVSAIFTTASETRVSDFAAAMGPADGSVYLSFRVSGVECDQWILTWVTKGAEAQSTTFVGHSCTVYDLQIGKEYIFTLSAGDESNVVGQTEVNYTAQLITRAENPVITACGNGVLTVQWDAPADVTVESWSVTCRDESGFVQTLTTDTCSATFQGMSHETACTIEIVAQGMPQGITTQIGPNPLNLLDMTMEKTADGQLLLQWTFTGTDPQQWQVNWTCDGYMGTMIQTAETFVTLPYIPGGNYTISLIPGNGLPIFGHTQTLTAPETTDFAGYGITAADMMFMMCAVPGTGDWAWNDIIEDDYRSEFTRGEQAGFVVQCFGTPEFSDETVSIGFLLRDEDGMLLQFTVYTNSWSTLWSQGFCELTIPQMPQISGAYQLEIYFDNMLVARQDFTVN